MKAKIGMAAAITLSATLVLLAGEFWKEKPYTEWTLEQAWKLLNDSPWARRVPGAAGGLVPPQRPQNPIAGGAMEGSSTGGEPIGGADTPSGQQPPQRSAGLEGEYQGSDTYVVRWWSAPILRQALVRAQVLEGRIRPEQGEEFLAVRTSEYVLAVLGERMEEFEGLEAEQLLARAHLKIKKQKFAPLRVNPLRGAEGKLRGLEFYFAREVDGQPVIGDAEKVVEFGCAGKRVNLQARFDLRKMRVGADLLL